ncbi:hypothetical protein DdX_09737 [Ditylenchus destructor]|uniref:Uncharacterized protein n=1 Tax=Ditylenchus destructor TaxID=166010 RepID=A0AAD4N5G6_9BILA|nr:hypothetical protein DdX_09737 [Ditylenchus destructor]
MMKQLAQAKPHEAKSILICLDWCTLSWEYSRSARRYIASLIAFQVFTSAISSYFLLWGRSRIYETADIAPVYVRECIAEHERNLPWNERLSKWLLEFRQGKTIKSLKEGSVKLLNDKLDIDVTKSETKKTLA